MPNFGVEVHVVKMDPGQYTVAFNAWEDDEPVELGEPWLATRFHHKHNIVRFDPTDKFWALWSIYENYLYDEGFRVWTNKDGQIEAACYEYLSVSGFSYGS